MPEIICEGPCNGQRIRSIDNQIRKWRDFVEPQIVATGRRGLPSIDEDLYVACVYTPHLDQGDGRHFKCTFCGTVRIYGAR